MLAAFLFLGLFSYTSTFAFTRYQALEVPIGYISKEFIATFLPSNPIIVEAGAYDGNDTLLMAKLWPDSQIHAFEPIPDIYLRLYNNVKKNKKRSQITCHPYALGNSTGKAKMFVSYVSAEQFASSSLLAPKEHLKAYPYVSFPKTLEVQVFTLDEWARQNNISHVDFLWLDMQGSELDMLKASTEILPTVRVIYTEVSHKEMYKGIALYEQVKEWLETRGFVAILRDSDNPAQMNNVLFVREELLP